MGLALGLINVPDQCMVTAQLEGLCGGIDLECTPWSGFIWIFIEDIFVDLDAESIAIRENKVAFLYMEGFGENFVGKWKWIHDWLTAVAVTGVFKPGGRFSSEAGTDLGVSDSFKFSSPVVEGELKVMLLTRLQDLLKGIEAAVVRDVSLHDVDTSVLNQVHEPLVGGFMFTSGNGDNIFFPELCVGGMVFRWKRFLQPGYAVGRDVMCHLFNEFRGVGLVTHAKPTVRVEAEAYIWPDRFAHELNGTQVLIGAECRTILVCAETEGSNLGSLSCIFLRGRRSAFPCEAIQLFKE
jgi:hypothetical protein